MELKQNKRGLRRNGLKVLIVPSGIETTIERVKFSFNAVLIVPSGIETCRIAQPSYLPSVLIVPSGIETFQRKHKTLCLQRINCT